MLGIRAKFNWLIVNLYGRNPWYAAYLRAATLKYQQSILYRLRMIEFGEEFAKEHFLTNLKSELPVFKWEARKDWKLMAKVIFMPFSVNLY